MLSEFYKFLCDIRIVCAWVYYRLLTIADQSLKKCTIYGTAIMYKCIQYTAQLLDGVVWFFQIARIVHLRVIHAISIAHLRVIHAIRIPHLFEWKPVQILM